MKLNKEQIYDAEINPLMAQIIAICQKNHLSMFATFDIPNEEDDGLACTTCLADESGKPSERIRKYNRIAQAERGTNIAMLTLEKPDGSKEVTAILP